MHAINTITPFTRFSDNELGCLSEVEIVEGFKKKNGQILKKYFFGYCEVAYGTWNKKYQLSNKEFLDFYTITTNYYVDLMEKEWRPLEVERRNASLCTWMVRGYYFKVQDALKEYNVRQEQLFREVSIEKEPSVGIGGEEDVAFVDIDIEMDINNICNLMTDPTDKCILRKYMLEGYTISEIAKSLDITPSAVSQRYSKIKKMYIVPYFNR